MTTSQPETQPEAQFGYPRRAPVHATVTKMFRFEAAHRLPNHDGKCRRPHGHSYKVEVSFYGIVNEEPDYPKEGMVIDFGEIKEIWNEIVPFLDHQNLNDTMVPRRSPATTAEVIAGWIMEQFRTVGGRLGIPNQPSMVTVWETESAFATVTDLDV